MTQLFPGFKLQGKIEKKVGKGDEAVLETKAEEGRQSLQDG